MISCLASETLHELKSLVLELDGYWLGSFQFVKAPRQEDASEDASTEALNEWSEIGQIFSTPEYEDPTVVRVLKVVEGQPFAMANDVA